MVYLSDEPAPYIHFNGSPDMLLDLEEVPQELNNLTDEPGKKEVIYEHLTKLIDRCLFIEANSRGSYLERQSSRDV